MSVATDIRTYLLSDGGITAITTRIYVNTVPTKKDVPFVWIRKQSVRYADELGVARQVEATFLDIEAVAADLVTAESLIAAVVAALEGATGTLGTTVYAWCLVHDQFDDYVPRNLDADETLEVAAAIAEVWHGTPSGGD